MTQQEDNNKGFVVKDKRRFDSDGNKNQDTTDSKDVKSDLSQKDITVNKNITEDKKMEDSNNNLDFSSFIVSLATQSLIQMGEIPAPEGFPEAPINLDQAKQTIDIILLLKEKTKGNLTDQEVALVDEISHTLQISFVKHTNG